MPYLPIFLLTLLFSLVPVTPPKARCTNRVLLLVDVSGSMHGQPIAEVIDSVGVITERGGDPSGDTQFGVLTFSNWDKQERWPGIPEKAAGVEPGWAGLPSRFAAPQAQAWLSSADRKGNRTRVVPGLRAALLDPQKNLTIVLMTDGNFDEALLTIHAAIQAGQDARVKASLHPAVIICVGTGEEDDRLKSIGDKWLGGYLRLVSDKPVVEPGPISGPPAPPVNLKDVLPPWVQPMVPNTPPWFNLPPWFK